jgi:hypothetical protein
MRTGQIKILKDLTRENGRRRKLGVSERRAWVCGRKPSFQGVSGQALAAMHHSP